MRVRAPGGPRVWLLSRPPRAGHIQGLPGVKQTVASFCFVGRKMHLPGAVGSLRGQPTNLLPGSAGRRPAAQSMDLMSFAKEVDGAGRRCCLHAGSRVAGSTSGVQFRGRRVLSVGPVSVAVCVCVCVCICMSGFSRIVGVVSSPRVPGGLGPPAPGTAPSSQHPCCCRDSPKASGRQAGHGVSPAYCPHAYHAHVLQCCPVG